MADLRVELREGAKSDQPVLELKSGEPRDAFGIGLEGEWRVRGPGINAVDAYLYWDGETLFVSSAEGSRVTVRGEVVPTEWQPIEVPSNVRFAAVKLAVRKAGRRSKTKAAAEKKKSAPKAELEPPAKHRAAQRAPVDDGMPEELPDDEKTRVKKDEPAPAPAPTAKAKPARPQGAMFSKPSEHTERTRLAPMEDKLAAPPDDERTAFQPLAVPSTGSPVPSRDEALPSTRRADEPLKAARAPTPRPAAGVPSSPPSSKKPKKAPGLAPGPARPSKPDAEPASKPAEPKTVGTDDATLPPSRRADVMAGASPPAEAPVAAPPKKKAGGGVGAALKKGWAEASFPQKVILILLPFAFVSVFFVFTDEPPAAPVEPAGSATRTAPSGAPSSAPVAPVEPAAPLAADAGEASEPPPAATEQPTPAPAPPAPAAKGAVSTERRAADAVAAGAYAEAIEHYEALSKEHPKKEAYQRAAEILRRKTARGAPAAKP